ncbi:hypothetical protein XAV_12285 [Xanthomonas axonopodis pv. vasculorum]|nr:hypothetical protein XAV_12285 [Xanthomonas axonopodis pv. vasculorum]
MSSLTRGREDEGSMPSQCSIAITVVALNDAPLSPAVAKPSRPCLRA